MTKFEYIGSPGDVRDGVTAYGHTFRLGEAVEVTDEFAIGKLSGNSHFKAVNKEPDTEDAPRQKRKYTRRANTN